MTSWLRNLVPDWTVSPCHFSRAARGLLWTRMRTYLVVLTSSIQTLVSWRAGMAATAAFLVLSDSAYIVSSQVQEPEERNGVC